MAWRIGICRRCTYARPDRYGGVYYCTFKARRRRFSLWKFRYVRDWTWLCDDCKSQTQQQRERNRPQPEDRDETLAQNAGVMPRCLTQPEDRKDG